MNRFGGFPEPFLSGSDSEAARWRNQYYTDLIREDILEFSRIHEIKAIRLLVELLRERVGSPLSYNSIAEDLQIAPNTVRKYVEILESLCIIFLVRPFHANIARAVLKEPKAYFFDSGYVKGDEGLKLENTCAVCLLKHVQYLQDTAGQDLSLRYVRTRDGREVDFAICKEERITTLLEVKLTGEQALTQSELLSREDARCRRFSARAELEAGGECQRRICCCCRTVAVNAGSLIFKKVLDRPPVSNLNETPL